MSKKKWISGFIISELPSFLMLLFSLVCGYVYLDQVQSVNNSIRDNDWIYVLIMVLFIYMVYLSAKLIKYIKHQTKINLLLESNKRYQKTVDTLKINHQDQLALNAEGIHQAKLPLATLKLKIEDIKEKLDKETHDGLQIEVERLNHRLEQVISLHRLDGFAEDVSIEVYDLFEEVRNCINGFKDEFIYNHIYPVIETEKSVFRVLTDKKWNTQMLNQIISNGIKYSAGSKPLYFSIIQEDRTTKLVIRDEGLGIPKHDIKRIFKPYFTGENGRKVNSSSGIGLYVVDRISQALNVKVEVLSEQGVGTSICLTYKNVR